MSESIELDNGGQVGIACGRWHVPGKERLIILGVYFWDLGTQVELTPEEARRLIAEIQTRLPNAPP